MAVVAMVLVSIYFLGNIAIALYCVWSWLRSPQISREEQQRADMRSCSWPTEDGTALASGLLQSKAKATLAYGQVSGGSG